MNTSEKFIQLLEKANIEVIDSLKEGRIQSLEIKQDGLSAKLTIAFPKVIDVNLEKQIRLAFKDYFTSVMGFSNLTLNLEYDDNNITKEALQIYYEYIFNAVSQKKPRVGILSTFKVEYFDNRIRFFVGSEDDKNIALSSLKEIEPYLKFYGLSVTLEVEVSPFEITSETKINEKARQANIEIQNYQNHYDSLGQKKVEVAEHGKKQPRMKTPLSAKPVPLSTIPASDVEVIEYQQKNGNTFAVVEGEVVSCEIRDIKTKYGKTLPLFEGVITDNTDSIRIKTFISEKIQSLDSYYRYEVKVGTIIKVYGSVAYDAYAKDVVLNIIDSMLFGKAEKKKVEVCDMKRVELHAHTKMSMQDSVLEVADYVRRASEYGYTALAITDHYNIHGLPDFYSACKTYNIKPIFGVEAGLVDEDKFKIALSDADINLSDATYVVYDLETTGLSSNYNEIIEVSACKVYRGQIIDEFSEYVKPVGIISEFITKLTSITNEDVMNAKGVEDVLPRFREFYQGCILVAHNATFDNSHIYANLKKLGFDASPIPTIDTLQLARVCYGNKLKRFDLSALCKLFDVELTQHHRAIYDAEATTHIFIRMLNDLLDKGITNYNMINSLISTEEAYKYAYPSHFTILAKNPVGKKNLYKIISDSHTNHFYKNPRVLKSFLNENREGLLIGSACVNSDVFETAYEKSYEELKEVMSFYDYIEIQPISLYDVLVRKDEEKKMRKDIISTLKTIVKCAHELNKLVVATGDVHHLDEEDKKYREIYIQAPRIGGGIHPLADVDYLPSFHFRSTDEMISELSFLGDEVYDIVCKNTLEIADEIEEYELFPNKLFAPQDDFLKDKGIDSVAAETEKMTYERAKEIYGDPIPKYIEDRLKKELDSIIGHKFATIYYISYMLVKYSTDAGYVVGSRGSVGSSLVAHMMRITEVNALAPHYYCPHCHFIAFKLTEDEKIKYPLDENQAKLDPILQSRDTGFDLPKQTCPVCGYELSSAGVDIPFETFLGFDGSKTPDIDLNFSGDFQAQAHEFCRTVFGVDRAFRAGTIQTTAEKTALGYVRHWLEYKGIQARRTEVERLGKKIEGAKRSTGQHPGGIVVIPKEIEYSDVIPIQYPADDTSANWRITHFDYHKFESNLLKLDILGHDDPTMIRHLMDFVHKYPDEFPFDKVEDIPLNDAGVFKLFNGLESLGLVPDQTFGQTIGTTGIPEFGTKLAKDMLSEIRPTSVAHLLKISGLSHGTDVWNGNARDFMLGLKQGFDRIPFNDLIGCRDDIMVYLMQKNLPAIDAFKIMEKVRKGKGLEPKQEQEMLEYGVPKWYIESCKLIKYMFPKAHATAYVIMALRIGWFKVYRPIFYYAGFFSRRADAYDVEAMAAGFDAVRTKLIELQGKKDSKVASNKEEETFETLLLAIEMLARGYSFKQMDINESEAINFKVLEDRKTLLIPFNALDSLGESTARSIVEAREQAPFTSKKDVLNRTKLNNTQFEKMNQMGVFGDLPDDSQVGLFSI